MDFYEVLEKRRTYRDFSDREVSDEILKRVIGAAFKAPTNDHLRQLEFVVIRSRENIAKVIAPARGEHGGIQGTGSRGGRVGRQRQDGNVCRCTARTAEDADAEQPAHHSVFPATDAATTQTCGAKFAQLFRFGMVCFGEYVARRHRRGFGYSVPYSCKRRSRENQTNCERSRRLRVFTCLLTMGYPTENAFLPKQKEIHIEERIHTDVW